MLNRIMVTDAERTEKNVTFFFIRCSSSDESRLDGDEGLRGACEELIKRMSIAYLTDKKRTKNGQLKDFAV